jgi:hypothetical protein
MLDPPTETASRRRGRPAGSISLTPEIEERICTLIQGGVFLRPAALAAGIPARTFEDWMARGEGRHPTRSSTRRLRAFAQRVRTAQAIARAGAEAKVYRENPLKWLARAAPSTPADEGWRDPPPEKAESAPTGPTLEDGLRELDMRRKAEVIAEVANERCPVPGCTHADCGTSVREDDPEVVERLRWASLGD